MRCLMLMAGLLMLAGCASAPLVTVAPKPDDYSWWLRTEYWPSGRTVRGIAVQQYDPRWCAADEITPRDFPEAATAGPRGLDNMMRGGSARFALADDFGSGEHLQVFLGAYATCDDGERGMFFAVLAPERPQGEPRIVQAEAIGHGTYFAYLFPIGTDGFAVADCFACDAPGRRYRWNAAEGRFLHEPYDVPLGMLERLRAGVFGRGR